MLSSWGDKGVRNFSASIQNVSVGDADPSSVNQFALFVKSNLATFSIVPQGRIIDSSTPFTDLQNLAYMKASNRTPVDPGVTPITQEGLYYIFGDGCQVFLDITISAGSIDTILQPVKG